MDLARGKGWAMFRGGPQGPVDKERVEELGKRVRHNPGQWSTGMLKLMIVMAVVLGGLLAWALLSPG